MPLSLKYIRWRLPLLIGGSALFWLYWRYNPYHTDYFPVCSFRSLTGFTCPGCGSQRTIHYLLHLDLAQAFQENAFLVLMLPYLVLLGLSQTTDWDRRLPKLRKALFGPQAAAYLLLLLLVFWIGRNLLAYFGYFA